MARTLADGFALSGDSKVTPLARCKGSKPRARGAGYVLDIEAKVRNSDGTLPARIDRATGIATAENGCDSATPFCGSCYAATLATARPAVAGVLEHNQTLTEVLCPGEQTHSWRVKLWEFQRELQRYKVPTRDWVYRMRWSGDHNPTTAGAFADAARDFPRIRFWCYTRNPIVAVMLASVPNITVYASVDSWNVDTWKPVLERNPAIHVAACGDTYEECGKIREKLGRIETHRGITCPENAGRLPVAVPIEGPIRRQPARGDMLRGACVACRVCVDGRADVSFSTSHQ